jgi:hypothetical protein
MQLGLRTRAVVLDGNGYPLRWGEPEYTDDDYFWDGDPLYRLVDAGVRRRQGVLTARGVVVRLPGVKAGHFDRLGRR